MNHRHPAAAAPDDLDRAITLGFGLCRAGHAPAPLADESFALPKRFAFLGVIGRGGVGSVLRARDRQLEREVAIKVLHAEHAQDPARARRFLAEAQVIAHLQHPGIVPVHELGLLADGRPYFAMQRVEGRSLAAALASAPLGDPAREALLQAFERIVETVAFAHARGVLHRDLKPANVMLGSFGEVQVMDWGLAKVRDAREPIAANVPSSTADETPTEDFASRSGSVFGTPGYIAPEQARGETERLNERADVFGLGAILCEILTGTPAHAGASADEALRLAVDGDLEDARRRLAACRSDARLVRLALQCLEPEPERRPRDAQSVERALAAWRAALAADAKSVEIANARAAAERRSKRLLAWVALLGLLVATLVIAWLIDRRARVERADAAISRSLAEVEGLRDRARSAPHVEAWNAALSAARHAELAASSESSSPTLAERARRLAASIENEREDVRCEAEHRKREAQFRDAVEEIELTLTASWDWRRALDHYERAFASYGIDVAKGDESAVAAALKSSAIADELIDRLDGWRAIASNLHEETLVLRERLERLALAADDDSARSALRRVPEGDLEALRAFAVRDDFRTLSVSTKRSLIARLEKTGDRALAERLRHQTWTQHAGDFWIAFHAGWSAHFRVPPDVQEETHWRAICAALRPESAPAWTNYGTLLAELGRRGDALEALDRAIALRPDLPMAHFNRGGVLQLEGRLEEALASYNTAWELEPADLECARRVTRVLTQLERVEEADAAFRRVLQFHPDAVDLRVAHGALLVDRLGRLDEGHATFERALESDPRCLPACMNLALIARLRQDPDARAAWLERALEIDPACAPAHVDLAKIRCSQKDWPAAEHHARIAAEIEPANSEAWYLLGNALAATSRTAESIAAFEKACEHRPASAACWFELGSSHLELGHFALAAESLQRAIELDPRQIEAHRRLGIARWKTGGLDEARAHFEAALALDESDLQVLADLCAILREQGRWSTAEDVAQRIHELQPSTRSSLLLGSILGEAWCDEEALRTLLPVADAGDVEAAAWAGIVLARLGRCEEACARFNSGTATDTELAARAGAAWSECRAMLELESAGASAASDPEHEEPLRLVRLARCASRRGELSIAVVHWEHALSRNAAAPPEWLHLAARDALRAARVDPQRSESYHERARGWLRDLVVPRVPTSDATSNAGPSLRSRAASLLRDAEFELTRSLRDWQEIWQLVERCASDPR